jgi:sterol 24-C-methyltransferase
MATKLAPKDFKADAEFAKALYGDAQKGGYSALLNKNKDAHNAAVDGYFKHWDNKGPKDETEEDRQVRLFLHVVG